METSCFSKQVSQQNASCLTGTILRQKFLSLFQELSEEEDDIENSEETKKHKSKLKELGAAIQKLLKKHEDNDEEIKSEPLDDHKNAKFVNLKEKKETKLKAKNITVEDITGALVKAANSKTKLKNATDDMESSGKSLKNESNDADNFSFEESAKSHEKGDKILEDLGLKKKKGLPLASAVARGEKPPCICPDKGKPVFHFIQYMLSHLSMHIDA